MMTSISDYLFLFAIYTLGVIGFLAITLMPLRSIKLLFRYQEFIQQSIPSKIISVLLVINATVCFVFAFPLFLKVSKCLIEGYCSANRSGGWLWLCLIGATYILLELISYILFKIEKLAQKQ